MEKRYADTSQQKKMNELEKVHALIEQKLKLTEQDLSDQKTKIAEKDKEMKELQKENYDVRVELQEKKQSLQNIQSEHAEALEELETKHQKEIQKIRDTELSQNPNS